MICFVLIICVFWFCYAVIINIWIHFCVFFIFRMIVSPRIMKFLNVSSFQQYFDHDSFLMSKRFTSHLCFKKKRFIFVDIDSHLFNINSVIEHNLIQFLWSYDVKILIYVSIVLFIFFMILFICEWYIIDSFHMIFNNLQMIFQTCFINCWFLFDIIIHDSLYCWKMIYTKIYVTFSTQICFISSKIIFLLNLSIIIIKFV